MVSNKEIKLRLKHSRGEKIVCPNCHTQNTAMYDFCQECGLPLFMVFIKENTLNEIFQSLKKGEKLFLATSAITQTDKEKTDYFCITNQRVFILDDDLSISLDDIEKIGYGKFSDDRGHLLFIGLNNIIPIYFEDKFKIVRTAMRRFTEENGFKFENLVYQITKKSYPFEMLLLDEEKIIYSFIIRLGFLKIPTSDIAVTNRRIIVVMYEKTDNQIIRIVPPQFRNYPLSFPYKNISLIEYGMGWGSAINIKDHQGKETKIIGPKKKDIKLFLEAIEQFNIPTQDQFKFHIKKG